MNTCGCCSCLSDITIDSIGLFTFSGRHNNLRETMQCFLLILGTYNLYIILQSIFVVTVGW